MFFVVIVFFKSQELKPKTQNLKPKKTAGFERIRDVEGGEAGTEWSASGMEYGSEAHPGTSPTAAGLASG